MPSHGLDKITLPPNLSDAIGCNTALHFCALFDKPESMKLLLRSGADINLRNSQDKTAFDVAQEMGHHTCQELVGIIKLVVEYDYHIFCSYKTWSIDKNNCLIILISTGIYLMMTDLQIFQTMIP